MEPLGHRSTVHRRHRRIGSSVYSSVLLLVASALLAVVATVAFNQQDRWWKNWTALSIMFCLLSIHEASGFHESLILPLQTHFGANGFFFFAWVIPGAFFVITVGLMFLKFVLNLDTPMRNRFIIAGSVFVVGTLGMECVGGAFIERLRRKTHPLHTRFIYWGNIRDTRRDTVHHRHSQTFGITSRRIPTFVHSCSSYSNMTRCRRQP